MGIRMDNIFLFRIMYSLYILCIGWLLSHFRRAKFIGNVGQASDVSIIASAV